MPMYVYACMYVRDKAQHELDVLVQTLMEKDMERCVCMYMYVCMLVKALMDMDMERHVRAYVCICMYVCTR